MEEDSKNPLSSLTNCELLASVYVAWSEAHFTTSSVCYGMRIIVLGGVA